MRSRSNSGVRLDGYARLVQETILRHQVSPDPHTQVAAGPQSGNTTSDAFMNIMHHDGLKGRSGDLRNSKDIIV